ncbi:MAG: ABC transporter substrate-binding protein [Gammaproteobacteria bacterium]|nr:ABC transporter substrate-binding protein [Gammaproteobacteria bacterium]
MLNTEHDKRRVVLMGYMPVITNLAAPILDHVTKKEGKVRFKAIKFSSFAEMAESLRNGEIDVAFMIAPLSIVLRQQGEDIKVIYIGNRHESTLVTRKDLNIVSLDDLIGKTIAVPMRYSGHNLSIRKLLDEYGLQDNINIVEMNPPDMASALVSGSLDAYYVGEPFAAQTLMSGDASLLFYVGDVWKDFICNLMVVRQEFIDVESDVVQMLVQGAARSGVWAKNNTDEAAEIVSRYWNQSESLVKYAMKTPENRIVYNQYTPIDEELQYMANLMKKQGLTNTNNIDGLVDDGFANNANIEKVEVLHDIMNIK